MADLKRKTIFYIFIYVSFFSSVYVLTKMIIPPLNGISYVFLRTLFGSVFLACLILAKGNFRDLKRVIKKDLKSFMITSLHLALSLVLSFLATSHTTPSNQSLLLNLTTVFIILLNFLIYKIIPKKIVLISAILTFGGIVLLLYPLEFTANETIVGDILMIASTIFGALYTIKMDKLSKKYPSPQISFSLALFISLYVLPLFFVFDGPRHASKLSGLQWVILITLAVGITGLLYTITALILSDPNMSSNILAIIMTLVPIFGAILGVIIYGENMSSINIVGAVFVVLGVFLIHLKKSGKKRKVLQKSEKSEVQH